MRYYFVMTCYAVVFMCCGAVIGIQNYRLHERKKAMKMTLIRLRKEIEKQRKENKGGKE